MARTAAECNQEYATLALDIGDKTCKIMFLEKEIAEIKLRVLSLDAEAETLKKQESLTRLT